MLRRLVLTGFLCGTGACSSCGGPGAPCVVDSECPSGDYCNVGIAACDGGGAVLTEGHCTRDCSQGACACASDEECPQGLCSNGACHGVGVDCAAPPACELPGCSLQTPPHQFCPVCVCATCEPQDAGADAGADAGTLCGTNACAATQMCCEYYGGIHPSDGGDSTPGCADLSADGGCPGGAVCELSDAGQVASCNIYQP